MALWILFILILAIPSLQDSLGTRIHVWAEGAPGPEGSPDLHSRRQPSCSRSRSRVAHSVLEDYLWGFVEQKNYTLPKKCKLHPNDMYREQEERKVKMHVNEWRCVYCNKIFRAEEFIDKHMENRHSDHLDHANVHCLANTCEIVHCDWYEREKLGMAVGKKGKSKRKCRTDDAARIRKACETVAQNCFPLSGGSVARNLHDFFIKQFCDTHTCASGTKMFPLGVRRRRRTNVLLYLLCVILFLGGVGFYAIIYIHLRDRKSKTGLQRAKKQPYWFLGKPKKTSGKQY